MNDRSQTFDDANVAEALRGLPRATFSFAADEVALAALQARKEQQRCDICGQPIERPASRGLLMWSRDGELRYEEPPLCGACSGVLGVTSFASMIRAEEMD